MSILMMTFRDLAVGFSVIQILFKMKFYIIKITPFIYNLIETLFHGTILSWSIWSVIMKSVFYHEVKNTKLPKESYK